MAASPDNCSSCTPFDVEGTTTAIKRALDLGTDSRLGSSWLESTAPKEAEAARVELNAATGVDVELEADVEVEVALRSPLRAVASACPSVSNRWRSELVCTSTQLITKSSLNLSPSLFHYHLNWQIFSKTLSRSF